MSKLRLSAKDCPCCMYCGLGNPNGDRLCLAHSNALTDGRGAFHKSPDDRGAIVCDQCHKMIDGVIAGLSKMRKRAMHKKAHMATVAWWKANGYL